MSMSIKASPDGTYGEILVNGAVVAKLPVSGNAVIPGLVGTVSQSGGVPTGAIIESGSNANGEYIRYADGTQICHGRYTAGASGAVTVSFPAAFAPGLIQVTGSTRSANATVYVVKVSGEGTMSFDLAILNGAGTYVATVASCIAIGRWF